MRTGVFLQARLSSSRLKAKVLLPIHGLCVIRHVMRALFPVKADVFVLLTDRESFVRLAPHAKDEGFEIFQGPSEDVLRRYCMAADRFGVHRIIRATGDNPLVSAKMANAIVRIHARARADLSHFLGLPLGTGVEVIETGALKRAECESKDPYEREHITQYLYRHRESFRVLEADCPSRYRMTDVKISLDTEEDYSLLSRIFQDLYRNRPIEIDRLVPWLKKNVSLLGRNRLEQENTPRAGSFKGNGNGSS